MSNKIGIRYGVFRLIHELHDAIYETTDKTNAANYIDRRRPTRRGDWQMMCEKQKKIMHESEPADSNSESYVLIGPLCLRKLPHSHVPFLLPEFLHFLVVYRNKTLW